MAFIDIQARQLSSTTCKTTKMVLPKQTPPIREEHEVVMLSDLTSERWIVVFILKIS
jgi:hypothetical protein